MSAIQARGRREKPYVWMRSPRPATSSRALLVWGRAGVGSCVSAAEVSCCRPGATELPRVSTRNRFDLNHHLAQRHLERRKDKHRESPPADSEPALLAGI